MPSSACLPGFRSGIILPTFHIEGMIALVIVSLYILVRNSIPVGPKCFNIIGEIPSGPIALEFLDFLIDSIVWAVVMVCIGSDIVFLMFLIVCRVSLVGLVVAFGVYCRLNWSAMYFGLFDILSLNFIPWLSDCFVWLSLRDFIVFHNFLVPC